MSKQIKLLTKGNLPDLFTMTQIGKAIKELDQFILNQYSLRTQTNVKRINEARRILINVLFSNGYELTYTVIKSVNKRDLI